MKFGFPVVTEAGTVIRVTIEVTRTPDNEMPRVLCRTSEQEQAIPIVLQPEAPIASYIYEPYITSLVQEKHLSLNITLAGGLPTERQSLVDAERKQLLIGEASGTLCFAILDRVDHSRCIESKDLPSAIYFTGIYRTPKLFPLLDGQERTRTQLALKLSSAIDKQWVLWVLESDAVGAAPGLNTRFLGTSMSQPRHRSTASLAPLVAKDSKRAPPSVMPRELGVVGSPSSSGEVEKPGPVMPVRSDEEVAQGDDLQRLFAGSFINVFRENEPSGLEWLIAELEEKYQIPFRKLSESKNRNLRLTTHHLLDAALPSEDLDGEFTSRLEAFKRKADPLRLLPIQRKAFRYRRELFFNKGAAADFKTRHVLISGPTGCGKTALIKAIALNGIVERGGGVLYIGPIRALVDDFDASFREEYGELLGPEYSGGEINPRIVMSSGDISRDDGAICRGDFALASIVNEKANVLLSADEHSKFLKRLSVVVVDELHLLCEPFRGGVLDLLLTKLLREARTREQERQQDPRIKPLQIIGISTEGIAAELEGYSSFDLGDHDSPNRPLHLAIGRRPISVDHQLAVIFEGSDREGRKFEMRDIISFQQDTHRRLDEQPGHFKEQYRKTFGRSTTAWPPLIAQRPKHYDGQFLDLLIEKSRKHAAVIAAIPGIKKLESIASGVTKRLKLPLDLREVPPPFEDAVKAAGLTKDKRDLLISWARQGVFVHHGQYPRVLRRAVERLFAVKGGDNDRHKILLTTETLTYGVNLTASCVILYTTTWSREDVHDPFAPAGDYQVDLTQNEYHNLLGRAGRLGRQRRAVLTEAIICVPQRELSNTEEREKFLRQYYTSQPIGRPASGAVTAKDFATLKFDSESKTYDLESGKQLSGFTYPCFRTVMDALRAVGGQTGATSGQVMNMLEDTVAYQSLKDVAGKPDLGKRRRFTSMVSHVLRLAADYQRTEGQGLPLVETLGDGGDRQRFAIALPGSALIDTGTRLESVEPISRWLDTIRQTVPSAPIELLIVGFLCTPDFLKTGVDITAERSAQEPAVDRLQRLKLELDNILNAELSTLVPDSVKRRIIIDEIIIQGERAIPVIKPVRLMPIAIMRLVTQILIWLRGGSVDEIERIGNHGYPSPVASQIQPKHAERLYYLCIMCYRYFDKWDGKFVEGHKSQLPRLALRLKFGLPLKAIPLFNAFSSEGLLPREGVTRLSEQIASALELLDQRTISARDGCRKLIDEDALNVKTVDDAARIVQKFYEQQLVTVFGLMSERYEGEAQFLAGAKSIAISSFLSACGKPQSLQVVDAILGLCPTLPGQDLHFVGTDNSAVFYEEAGDAVFQVCAGDVALPAHWRLASWFDAPDADRSLTPCAYVLIASLLERGLVSLRDVSNGLRNCLGLVGVKAVVERVMVTEACGSVPRLREGLLEFFEPAML